MLLHPWEHTVHHIIIPLLLMLVIEDNCAIFYINLNNRQCPSQPNWELLIYTEERDSPPPKKKKVGAEDGYRKALTEPHQRRYLAPGDMGHRLQAVIACHGYATMYYMCLYEFIHIIAVSKPLLCPEMGGNFYMLKPICTKITFNKTWECTL